ncbi:MAG: shikimate dehydrogenase, partial [Peptidiphaga gingivicola]
DVAVIGAGGAGSAVYTQAALDGAGRVSVFKRANASFGPTSQKIAALSERTGVSLTLTDVADEAALERAVREADIVVDATRVGMSPLESQSNVKEEWLRPGQAVVDTVYHPRETKLLALAAHAGATPIDGLGMLLWQAAIAEEIWLDVAMPVDRVREAVFGG